MLEMCGLNGYNPMAIIWQHDGIHMVVRMEQTFSQLGFITSFFLTDAPSVSFIFQLLAL